jgi:capsular polysaccharide biosynthesis protein
LFVLDRRNIFYDLGIDNNHVLGGRAIEVLIDGFHGRGIRRLGGVGCYVSNNVLANYNHWMFAALPMLHYCRSSGYEPDWVYVNASTLPPHVLATLERAGIPSAAIISEPCSGDVNVMTLRDWRFGERPESFQFVRSLYADALRNNPARSSRIYVRRGKVPNRNLINSEEIDHLLNTQYGMEPVVMDGLRIEEQAEIFYNADVVVAAHGAALTNLIFSKPGTLVIELCSPAYLQGDIKDMARTTNLRHIAIVGKVEGNLSLRPEMTYDERFAVRGSDYTVPASELIAALESAGVT